MEEAAPGHHLLDIQIPPVHLSVGGFEALQSGTVAGNRFGGLLLHDTSFPTDVASSDEFLNWSAKQCSSGEKCILLFLASEIIVQFFQYLLAFLNCKSITATCARRIRHSAFRDFVIPEEPAGGGMGDNVDSGHNHGGHGPRYAHLKE